MIRLLSIVLIGIFAAGCGGGSSVRWSTPNKTEGEIKTILVAALSPVPENRITAEEEMVYWLRKNKYNAFASIDFIKPEKRLPRPEEIEKILNENNLDGLITLRLKDVEEDSRYVSANERNAMTINQGYYYNYMNAWNAYFVPGYYSKAKMITIESNVYETSDGKIVFTADSDAMQATNIEYTISDLVQGVVSNIKTSKVLTPSRKK